MKCCQSLVLVQRSYGLLYTTAPTKWPGWWTLTQHHTFLTTQPDVLQAQLFARHRGKKLHNLQAGWGLKQFGKVELGLFLALGQLVFIYFTD